MSENPGRVADAVAPAISLRHIVKTTDFVVATQTKYLLQPLMLRRPDTGTGRREVVCDECGVLVSIAVRSAADVRRSRLRWSVVFLAGLAGFVLSFLVRGPLGQGLSILTGLVAFVGGIVLWVASGASIVGSVPGHDLQYGTNGQQPLHHFVMRAVTLGLYGAAFLAGGLALDVFTVLYDGPKRRAVAAIVIGFAIGLALIALGVWFGVQIATGIRCRRSGKRMPVLLRRKGD